MFGLGYIKSTGAAFPARLLRQKALKVGLTLALFVSSNLYYGYGHRTAERSKCREFCFAGALAAGINSGLNSANPSNENKTVYLTFDDGPSANTVKVLDTLKTYGIKATFFVNGYSRQAELYKRIVNEGHAIGNHTYSHDYKYIYSSTENLIKDIEKLNNLLEKHTGVIPDIFRFPGGSDNYYVIGKYNGGRNVAKQMTQAVKEAGFEYFDWNVLSKDADVVTQDKNVIINAVLKGVEKNNKDSIVLFHDSSAKTTTAEALPEILNALVTKGYKFSTLSKNSYIVHF